MTDEPSPTRWETITGGHPRDLRPGDVFTYLGAFTEYEVLLDPIEDPMNEPGQKGGSIIVKAHRASPVAFRVIRVDIRLHDWHRVTFRRCG